MSSSDAWLNVLSGISQGSFDKIYLGDASGNVVDLHALLAAGGCGIANNAVLPLSLNSRVLSLDLNSFCIAAASPLLLQDGQMSLNASYITTATYNADMQTKIDTLTASSGVQIAGSGSSRTLAATGWRICARPATGWCNADWSNLFAWYRHAWRLFSGPPRPERFVDERTIQL